MDAFKYFIEDFLSQLIDEAIEAKKDAETEFGQGRLIGYYGSILSALNRADSFGILDEMPEKIREFNPEDLLAETDAKIN